MMVLRFASAWPWWVILLIALSGAILIARWYWRESKAIARPWCWVLPALRAMALLGLIAMLSAPILEYRWVDGELGRVAVIVDTSRSMNTRDKNETENRMERVTDWLLGPVDGSTQSRSALEQMRESNHIQLFSTRGERLWDSLSDAKLPTRDRFSATDANSPLGNAIRDQWIRNDSNDTGSESGAGRLQAIVLLSDGQNNGTPSPMDIVSTSKTTPILAVGLGDETEPSDLAILAADVSASVRREDRLRGKLTVKERLPLGTRYQVVISHDGQELFRKSVQAAGRWIHQVEFDASIRSALDRATSKMDTSLERRAIPLDLECSVVLDSTDLIEYSTENNRLQTSTWGVIKQNKVLLVDPRGRWEARYVRNALERDPTWTLQSTLGIANSPVAYFPKSRTELFEYDLVIATLDAVSLWNEAQLRWLAEFVSDAGGGVIWIDSARSSRSSLNATESIAKLLPIERAMDSSRNTNTDLSSNQIATSLRLSTTGLAQSAFRLGNEVASNDQIWQSLPAPHTLRRGSLKPGAESLVMAKTGEREEYPLVATMAYGQGRVLYFATDETWRWRYDVADLHHQRFWNQVSNWCMKAPFVVRGEFVALDAGRRVYQPNESATIRARVLGDRLQPLENGSIQMVVKRDGSTIATYPMREVTGSGGVYTVTLGPFDDSAHSLRYVPGEYTVQLEAVGVPAAALDVTTSFVIAPKLDTESENLACNSELLEKMATATDGIYVSSQQADRILERLSKESTGRWKRSEIAIWQSYPWFIVILSLLAAEWYLRKKVGLV